MKSVKQLAFDEVARQVQAFVVAPIKSNSVEVLSLD